MKSAFIKLAIYKTISSFLFPMLLPNCFDNIDKESTYSAHL